ncbi:MAG: universal stress protein [Candidatus Odinarchaeota archaeon]
MYKKILVGIDESQDAMDAVKKALEFGKKDNAEVVVFHSVIHHLTEISPGISLTASGSTSMSLLIQEDYIEIGKKLLKKVEDLFKKNNKKVETRLILDIPPEDYIKNITFEEKFDLVILGCKGKHSKLKQIFLGTIPNRAVNNASCDVLIVR